MTTTELTPFRSPTMAVLAARVADEEAAGYLVGQLRSLALVCRQPDVRPADILWMLGVLDIDAPELCTGLPSRFAPQFVGRYTRLANRVAHELLVGYGQLSYVRAAALRDALKKDSDPRKLLDTEYAKRLANFLVPNPDPQWIGQENK